MSDTTISEAYSFTRTGAAVDEQLLQSGRGGAGWRRSWQRERHAATLSSHEAED